MLASLIPCFHGLEELQAMRSSVITTIAFMNHFGRLHICASHNRFFFSEQYTVNCHGTTPCSPLFINRERVPFFGHRLLNCSRYNKARLRATCKIQPRRYLGDKELRPPVALARNPMFSSLQNTSNSHGESSFASAVCEE